MAGEIQRQYVGARYVPKLAEPYDWSSSRTYEAMEMVITGDKSYISRIPVPEGVEITDEKYWAPIGNRDAYIEQVQNSIAQTQTNLNNFQNLVYEPFVSSVETRFDFINDSPRYLQNAQLILLCDSMVGADMGQYLEERMSPTKIFYPVSYENIAFAGDNTYLKQLQNILALGDFDAHKPTNIVVFYGQNMNGVNKGLYDFDHLAHTAITNCRIMFVKSSFNPANPNTITESNSTLHTTTLTLNFAWAHMIILSMYQNYSGNTFTHALLHDLADMVFKAWCGYFNFETSYFKITNNIMIAATNDEPPVTIFRQAISLKEIANWEPASEPLINLLSLAGKLHAHFTGKLHIGNAVGVFDWQEITEGPPLTHGMISFPCDFFINGSNNQLQFCPGIGGISGGFIRTGVSCSIANCAVPWGYFTLIE